MSRRLFGVSSCGTHHVDTGGRPAYADRFDEVLSFRPPGLAAVRRGDDAWHIREDGSAAYARRFSRTFGHYEHLAAVVDSTGWHHVNAEGEDAYPQRYAWCGNFQDGRCTVRDDEGGYTHIGPNGHATYPERWRYAGDFRGGIAVVQAADGRSTHIRPDGTLLHGRWFVDLDVYHKRLARARDEDGWMHIDVHGRPAHARRFHAVEPFYNGQARVERFDGALEVIDERGATVCELRPPRGSEFAALSGDMARCSTRHRMLRRPARHDSDDADARRTLTHARATLPHGGRVCIVDLAVPEESAVGAMCDLHVLLTSGGRERTTEEFRRLLAATGFALSEVRTAAALPSIIIGVTS